MELDKKLLENMLAYIEECEIEKNGRWDHREDLKNLIDNNLMPPLYWVLKVLEAKNL